MGRCIFIVLLILNLRLQAQVNVDTVYRLEKIKRSTSFASLTLGLDMLFSGHGSYKLDNQTVDVAKRISPRINIGGTHFWGHADFYVSFPLGFTLGNKKTEPGDYRYLEGVETGAKVYPWAMKPKRITPYVGISFQPMSFYGNSSSTDYEYGSSTFRKFVTPVHVGVTFTSKQFMFNGGLRYHKTSNIQYFTSPTSNAETSISPVNFNFSVFRFIDTNKSLAVPKEIDQLNIKHYVLKKENALDAWYWAIGPSAALQLSKSRYFQKYLPYFYNDMNNSSLVPEVALGRYFSKPDINVNLSLRYMYWNRSAFDTNISMSRASIALEGYKFLFDYHGFVPFVGPSIMYDRLSYKENQTHISQNKPAIGVVFGWDIRLSKTSTSLLRTNLRYAPNHNLPVKGEKVMYDHLEFNFIQYVKFFGRNNIYKKYTKNKG